MGGHGYGDIAASLHRGHQFMKQMREHTLMHMRQTVLGMQAGRPMFDKMCRSVIESAEAYSEAAGDKNLAWTKYQASARMMKDRQAEANDKKASEFGLSL